MMVTISGALPIAPAKRRAGGTGKRPSAKMEVRSAPLSHDTTFFPTTLSLRNWHRSSCALPCPQALALTSMSHASAAGYCLNPGIPIGTRKVGSQYRLEDTVTYYCSRGLTLRGSKQRTCQEGGSWSGTEPSCHGDLDPYPHVRSCSPILTFPYQSTAFSPYCNPAPSSLLNLPEELLSPSHPGNPPSLVTMSLTLPDI